MFDKLYVVHLQNAAGQISKFETFASSEHAAVKLAQAKKAKALVPELWGVAKIESPTAPGQC